MSSTSSRHLVDLVVFTRSEELSGATTGLRVGTTIEERVTAQSQHRRIPHSQEARSQLR